MEKTGQKKLENKKRKSAKKENTTMLMQKKKEPKEKIQIKKFVKRMPLS